jgi:hypothetical protein
MQGIKGLIIAIGFGIAGALLNFAYLQSKASKEEKVAFVGIKAERTVNRGQVLAEEDITPVSIPKLWVGNLDTLGVLYESKTSVLGQKALRNLTGERLLLRDDFGTPPPELNLEPGEELRWIPVDTRAFVPSLVSPGDRVSFLVTRPVGPTPAVRGLTPRPNPDEAAANVGMSETIGPFTILALGNRLSSAKVWGADKKPQIQENVLGIRVKKDGNERQAADKLWQLLEATNFHQVGVVLLSRKQEQ